MKCNYHPSAVRMLVTLMAAFLSAQEKTTLDEGGDEFAGSEITVGRSVAELFYGCCSPQVRSEQHQAWATQWCETIAAFKLELAGINCSCTLDLCTGSFARLYYRQCEREDAICEGHPQLTRINYHGQLNGTEDLLGGLRGRGHRILLLLSCQGSSTTDDEAACLNADLQVCGVEAWHFSAYRELAIGLCRFH